MKSINEYFDLQALSEKERENRIAKLTSLFSGRMKELRNEKNLSQKQLASKLGIPVSTYANWEQGRRDPSIYDIFNLLWVLKIDANELFYLEDTTTK